jgi:DNA-binding winged helix-turn-helix (wHTH) protein
MNRDGSVYEFSGFRFDPRGGLERGGRSIHLAPLEHRALGVLLNARGRIVEKDMLAQAAWNGGTPSDYSIARCVHLLRRALAHPETPDLIETFHGRGYRIAVPVRELPVEPASAPGAQGALAADAVRAARELVGRRTSGELASAVAILAEAVARDPLDASALAMIAEIRVLQAVRRHVAPRELAPKIVESANAALAIDPGNAWAFAARGWASALVGWDYASGLADVDRSLALDPRYVRGRNMRWWILCGLGRNDDALAECISAADVSPLSPWLPSPLAWSYAIVGQVGKGLDIIRAATERFPTLDMVFLYRCLIAALAGEHGEAIDAGEKAMSLSQGSTLAMTGLAHAYASAGRRDEARMVLRWIGEAPLGAPPSLVVPVHAALGDHEAALASLAQGAEQRCPWLALASADPRNAPLRARPEFVRLARAHRARAAVAA